MIEAKTFVEKKAALEEKVVEPKTETVVETKAETKVVEAKAVVAPQTRRPRL